MYTLYQFLLPPEAWEAIRTMPWEQAEEMYSDITMFKNIRKNGFQGFDTNNLKNYVKVALVNSDSLDKIHNLAVINTAKLLDSDFSNNERSIGVGDIVHNQRTNQYLMIDNDGYTPLDLSSDSLE